MKDDWGMSNGLYTELIIASFVVASIGTMAFQVTYTYKLDRITDIGKIKGKSIDIADLDGYSGIRFRSKDGKYYFFEFRPNHNSYGPHIQWNKVMTKFIISEFSR